MIEWKVYEYLKGLNLEVATHGQPDWLEGLAALMTDKPPQEHGHNLESGA